MAERHGLVQKVIRVLIYGRLDPVESLIALFILAMGIWLSVRAFVVGAGSSTFFGTGVGLQITAAAFAILAALHLYSMHRSNSHAGPWFKIRVNTLFLITIAMLFATIEIFMAVGLGETRWMPWLTLTLISAATYLSLVVKR